MKFTKYRSLKESEIKEELLKHLSDLLPDFKIEEVATAQTSKKMVPDLVLSAEVGKIRKTLLIEIKSIGEPKIAKEAIYHLNRLMDIFPDSYPVFSAPFIGERSREICIEEGIGYIDLTGNAYLKFNTVLVDRISKNSSRIERENARSIFSAKATRVIRKILEIPLVEWRIIDIANACDMSPAGVYYVLNQLENKGYIERTENRKVKVIEPRKLLLDWGINWTVDKSSSEKYFSFSRSVEELIELIAVNAGNLGYDYAFTGMAGASLVSPFVRFTDVWLYLSGESKKMVERLDLRPVSTGANVVIFMPYDKGVFMGEREINGKRVVSDVQLFLDLYKYPARGQEQAERILEAQLEFEVKR